MGSPFQSRDKFLRDSFEFDCWTLIRSRSHHERSQWYGWQQQLLRGLVVLIVNWILSVSVLLHNVLVVSYIHDGCPYYLIMWVLTNLCHIAMCKYVISPIYYSILIILKLQVLIAFKHLRINVKNWLTIMTYVLKDIAWQFYKGI